MDKEEKYQKRYLKKIKLMMAFSVLLVILVFAVMTLSLNKHLFTIQNIERLAKYPDYSLYRLSFGKNNKCGERYKTLVYENEDIKFYTLCKNDIYVYYDSTKTTLSHALKNEYLTLDLLKNPAKKESFKDYQTYTFVSAEKSKDSYMLTIKPQDNDKTLVSIESL